MSFCFALVSKALAHGGPPAVEGVLARDERGPWLVELSEGFALRSERGAWSFVCPALFGSDFPPLSATVADETWIAGGTDLFRLSAAASLTTTDRPELAGPHVLALGALGDALLALRFTPSTTGTGTQLVRLRVSVDNALEPLFESAVYWSALAVQPAGPSADEQLWLGRIDGAGLEMLALSATGETLQSLAVALPGEPLSLRLSVAGEHVFAHVLTGSGSYTLLHVADRGEPAFEAEVVVEATLPIRGPIVRGDEVLLTRNEQLLTWSPGSVELSDSLLGASTLSCLTDDYACTQTRLYALEQVDDEVGLEPAAALFDLADLMDPTLFSADAELGQYCTAQWLVFESDLMRAGITGGDGGVAMPGGDGGLSDPDAGDAATTQDAALDTDSGRDAGEPSSPSSSGCRATRVAEDASGSERAWLSLGAYAAAIYLRRRRAHAASASKVQRL